MADEAVKHREGWAVFNVGFAFTYHGLVSVYAPNAKAAVERVRACEGNEDESKLESFDTDPGVAVDDDAADLDEENEPDSATLVCEEGAAPNSDAPG